MWLFVIGITIGFVCGTFATLFTVALTSAASTDESDILE